MSTQYDKIGELYGSMKQLPGPQLEIPSIRPALGDVKGLRILDLACGLGYWTRWLVSQGADRILGVDISSTMIDIARKDAEELLSPEQQTKVSFFVGDAGQPSAEWANEGPFDVVFAAWFLNYAGDEETQTGMWKTVAQNLKPGGKFVAITPNVDDDMSTPTEGYGVKVEPVERVKNGWKCRLTADTRPEKVQFEMYHLERGVFERSAQAAGMKDLEWRRHVLPEDTKFPDGYWDEYEKRPHMYILVAEK